MLYVPNRIADMHVSCVLKSKPKVGKVESNPRKMAQIYYSVQWCFTFEKPKCLSFPSIVKSHSSWLNLPQKNTTQSYKLLQHS